MATWQELLDGVRKSAVVVSIVPREGQLDEKFSRETGLAVCLDKPIILLVPPGAIVPNKLWAVADRVVSTGKSLDDPVTQNAIHEALTDVVQEIWLRESREQP